jgi:hypothetical protein
MPRDQPRPAYGCVEGVEAHRADPNVWHGLVDNDQWQDDYLTGDDLAEINFWLGQDPGAKAASTAVRAVSSH